MTRLFKSAAGMGLPSSRCARLWQAHTGDLQKRRYTNVLRKVRVQSDLDSILLHSVTRLANAGIASGHGAHEYAIEEQRSRITRRHPTGLKQRLKVSINGTFTQHSTLR